MRSDAYVDGFMQAVPNANKDIYRQHAIDAAKLFKRHGALELVECWGDDVPEGTLTSMPMAVKCQPDETVVFSWIVWPSREARDRGMQAAMADPACPKAEQMPFDGKRMIWGGFRVLVNE